MWLEMAQHQEYRTTLLLCCITATKQNCNARTPGIDTAKTKGLLLILCSCIGLSPDSLLYQHNYIRGNEVALYAGMYVALR